MFKNKIIFVFFCFFGLFLWMPVAFSQYFYALTHRSEPAGFFSVFHTVLGALDFMEISSDCCGLIVNFEKKGFYYDKEYGKNWWKYYFEPIDIGKKTDVVKKFSNDEQSFFTLNSEFNMSRKRGNELIRKYIFLKPHVQNRINNFYDNNLQGNYIIGVHYRGTDKCLEADIVPYKDVYEHLQAIIKDRHSYKILIATDDYYFLNYMNVHFPGRIIATNSIRSDEGAAVHFIEKGHTYKKGEDAIVDCILLSKCDLLLKTSSNLSNCSIKFNPKIPIIELNKSNIGLSKSRNEL